MHVPVILLALLASLTGAAPTDASYGLTARALCDDSPISQPPPAPTPLPAPPAGTRNILVAIGKGTQNYTCGSDSSLPPTAIGAKATLYDASCLARYSPQGLAWVTRSTKNVPGPVAGLPVIGQHYFSDSTTPVFVINGVGMTSLKKKAASPAPPNDSGDVPWLYLEAQRAGTTDNVLAVYREGTSGGSAPPTCAGRAAGVFTVNYAADYYFYSL